MHTFSESILTPFRLPGIVVDEYRYQNDKEYRERIDKQQEELEKKEEARIAQWQAKLDEFIKEDLAKEEANASPETK
jgi:type IV secretory pathway TraG/TraD family ATPase VirD4